MPRMKTDFLHFVRQVVKGDMDKISRCLAANPSRAVESAPVGATRQADSKYFFSEIADYIYSRDKQMGSGLAAWRPQLLNCAPVDVKGAAVVDHRHAGGVAETVP